MGNKYFKSDLDYYRERKDGERRSEFAPNQNAEIQGESYKEIQGRLKSTRDEKAGALQELHEAKGTPIMRLAEAGADFSHSYALWRDFRNRYATPYWLMSKGTHGRKTAAFRGLVGQKLREH